jgi:hypothetical protein
VIRVGQIARDFLEAGAMGSLIGLFGFIDDTFLTKSGDLGAFPRLSVPTQTRSCGHLHANRRHKNG